MLVPRTSKVLLLLLANIWMCLAIGTDLVPRTRPIVHINHSIDTGGNYPQMWDSFRGPQSAVQGSPQTARGIGRSVVVSVLLLITIIVAGTYTVRKDEPSKETRECPLKFMVSDKPLSKYSSKAMKEIDSIDLVGLADSWSDSVLTSKVFQCIFDPSEVMLDMLLNFPPPTFIRRGGADSSDLNAIIAQFQTLRRTYVSLSDGN